jgi:hypothetical protein
MANSVNNLITKFQYFIYFVDLEEDQEIKKNYKKYYGKENIRFKYSTDKKYKTFIDWN